VIICPNCERENPDDAAFCNACGTPLEKPAAREERKIVTVLFVDLVGFTARAEQLDPEDVRAILNPYYTRLRAEIEVFGGTVEKFIGDAVMAVFGAPVAHGDDPERAVRAALAVRDAVTQMNEAEPELDLQVRLAVNTGEAIVALGANPALGEGLVAGDVVNTASRLQTAAPTNGILVGQTTHRATRGSFEYAEVEALVVKGKRAPVRAWLANSASSGPGERASSGVPMLGRVHELAVLNRIFDGVVADRRPHLVTVVGDAGIGKTRLGLEFSDRLEREGARVLRGRSLPYGAVTTYGTFAQHVKGFAEIFANDDAELGREKLRAAIGTLECEDAEELSSDLALLIGLEAGREVPDRQTLFRAARRFVELLAADQPTILLFEDIHWAGSGTFDLVEMLASRVRDVPLLLLALARPDLQHARPGWGGGMPAYTALSLQALDDESAAELALQLLGAEVEAATSRVVETAEGNPLFIEELAASVAERSPASAAPLPTTIRELISARLDALPPSERTVLLDAAVVGKLFWLGALESLDGSVGDLPKLLDSLEARDLVRREPLSWIEGDEQYTFKHVMIREVAYATLPRTRRRELHAAAARFLEDATGDAAATATALAEHWQEAGNAERALDYIVLAADQAAGGWAKDEAAALYARALDLVPDDDPRRRQLARKQALANAATFHLTEVQIMARRGELGG
jgi:class 3 adenylate cyclase